MPDELSQEDIDALLAGAADGGGPGADADASLGTLLGTPEPLNMPDLGAAGQPAALEPVDPGSLDMLYDVEMEVEIELGKTQMKVEDVLRLREGSVVQLDKDAGAPVDILINGRLVAEGEVLVLNDFFCIRVTNILSDRDRAIMAPT